MFSPNPWKTRKFSRVYLEVHGWLYQKQGSYKETYNPIYNYP